MKRTVLTLVIAVFALAASVNANAQNSNVEKDFVIEQIASQLSFDDAYVYTLTCQRFLNEAKKIKSSVRLTEAQKQNRLNNLKGIYADRFSTLLDTWQTEATLQQLAD